jgi:thioredoxin 1
MSESIAHLSDATFAETVAASDKPVLVDFWASWCKPCLAIAPVLEDIASEYGDKLQVAKVDVDANGDTARQFDVRSIPTLIVFEGGQPTKRFTGARSKAQLVSDLGL